MRLVKRKISNQKPIQAAHSKRVEDHSVEGWSDDLAMRQQLCKFMIALYTLVVVFAGVLVVLHGIGLLILPTTVLTTLVIVVFGATPRMLGKIVKFAFHQE
jgi:hypothetical protein